MKERIVVVDDERIILELTSMILSSKGYEVMTAENALEGLALVARHSPAVVLLDYMMPKMDGMTALRKIRREFPETYVIMFTGKGSEEIAVEMMKSGASDYILKPFNNQDLTERIESVLRLRRIELTNRELLAERERLLGEVEAWNLELERRVEEKTHELERAHQEIVQSEKLAALGHLSAGMAHEIRNPLNSISLFAQLLKGELAGDAEKSAYADKIVGEVDRIDSLLLRLLAASKSPHLDLTQVDVNQVIGRVLEVFSDQIRAQRIALNCDLADQLPAVSADAGEIELIVSNLLSNALYALAEGGQLKIATSCRDDGILISVADTGAGIPQENLSQIFDPFFTTKQKGSGFGLSVVLRIVKSYRGKINVESQPGRGAVFTVSLPASR